MARLRPENADWPMNRLVVLDFAGRYSTTADADRAPLAVVP